MNKAVLTLVVVLVAFVPQARAQYFQPQIPPPVDLGIRNIPQETPVWCWVAVAQQIIFHFHGPNGTPAQCGLVAIASNLQPEYCCQNPTPCLRTGLLEEIQALILHFGGRFSYLSPPADAMSVYQTLATGHAIIMAVKASPYSGHVVIIRGMAWEQTNMGPQPVLYLNDPMGYFTRPVPFLEILPYWMAAIVVS